MRFMLGLMLGALGVVLLATDPSAWPQAAAGAARNLLVRHAPAAPAEPAEPATTSAPAVPAPPAVPSAPPPAPVASSPEPVADDGAWPEPAVLPQAFDEDYAWWSAAQTAPAAGASSPPASAVDDGFEARAEADATAPSDVASVWIPFHSERSATGFADRLSRALEHPFSVRRQGPGAYEVVFPFDDASQRDALLTQVATLTGLQP
ncbi:MAG TPA: hypothetical protein VLA56_03795 [Pseudomonadales bacterium]|nr:hypothetical protein [Pseudomonadales bacterium]